MGGKEFVLLLVGVAAGYYVVCHYMRTKSVA